MSAKKVILEGEVVEEDDGIRTLSTGLRVRFHHVNSMTIQRAGDSIPIPPVYEQAITQSSGAVRFVQNPNHPDYKVRVDAANVEKSLKSLEAMILFGVELVDPLPPDSEWLDDLSMVVDLEKYYRSDAEGNRTLSDKAKKLIYVMHRGAQTAEDYRLIAQSISVTEEAVQERVKAFPGNS